MRIACTNDEVRLSVLGHEVKSFIGDKRVLFKIEGDTVVLMPLEHGEKHDNRLKTMKMDRGTLRVYGVRLPGDAKFGATETTYVIGDNSILVEIPPEERRHHVRKFRSFPATDTGRRVTDRSPEEKVKLALQWLRESAHEVDGLKLLCRGDEIKAADLSARIEIIREL